MLKSVFLLALLTASGSGLCQDFPSPDDEHKLLRSAIACFDEGDMKLLQKFVLQNDREAFEQATGYLIYQHRCLQLEKGQDIFLDRLTADFLAEIRPKGEVRDVWVQFDAVVPRAKDR